jgi:hypothetical protein
MDNTASATRGLWLTIIVTAAAVVATITGLIFLIAPAPLLGVVGSAGATFAASVSLGITARRFLTE